MLDTTPPMSLPWLGLEPHFPDVNTAWGEGTPAPGLLAAGGQLTPDWLLTAYRLGIFPWFSAGEPPLWWSPNPRMVLVPERFRLHRSLIQAISKYRRERRLEIRFDSAFQAVITACANILRGGRLTGTWIQPSMIEAYTELHRLGFAHSVECWLDDRLVGGLYCVAIGHAIFGESMFSLANNTSKIALAALVGFCLENGIGLIDCQQSTQHLTSMGGYTIARDRLCSHVHAASALPNLLWRFDEAYWQRLSHKLA